MDYKRVLTVQDISCLGQCSLTVALPVISACGVETSVLPTALLSSHTAFSHFSFYDLTPRFPEITSAWSAEGGERCRCAAATREAEGGRVAPSSPPSGL